MMKDGWELKRLGELTRIKGGKRVPLGNKLSPIPTTHPYIRVSNFDNKGSIDMSDIQYISDEVYESIKNYTITDKDIYISIAGTIGKAGIIPSELNGANLTENACKLVLDSRTDRYYLLYYIMSPDFQNQAGLNVRTVAMPKLALTRLSNIIIPHPPLAEQKKIAALLDDVLSRIDKARENIEKNVKYAEKLFLSKSNKVFTEILETYGSVKLESITELITKGSSPKWQGVNYTKEPGILFVTSENVSKGHMDFSVKKYVESRFSDIERKSVLKKGDVLTNIVGASIGRTAIYTGNEIANINQAICLIRCNSIKISNTYLMYLLNSPYFIQVLHDNEIDNARANLSLSFFRNLTIPCPSLEVQQDTVAELDALEKQRSALTNLYTQKLQALDELRNSLLEKAFRGELT